MRSKYFDTSALLKKALSIVLGSLWFSNHLTGMKKIIKTIFLKLFRSNIGILVPCAFGLLTAGCQTTNDTPNDYSQVYESVIQQVSKEDSVAAKSLILTEGDIVSISFAGAPNLDTVQQIRRDGKITLQLIGEMSVVGMTPPELEKEIIRLCGSQLVTKEVRVAVDSSLFPIFVSGAVIKPGKIMLDRPVTALQAIMEAGGFDYSRANLKSVRIIRQEGNEIKNFQVNLKLPLQGKPSEPFPLKPADIIYVPEKFTWF